VTEKISQIEEIEKVYHPRDKNNPRKENTNN